MTGDAPAKVDLHPVLLFDGHHPIVPETRDGSEVAPTRLCLICQIPKAECWCDDDDGAPARRGPRPVPDPVPPRCPHCLDNGMVCEDHPQFPFGEAVEGHRAACGAGMPCPACCSPIPADGTHSIAEAFTPDWLRGGGA